MIAFLILLYVIVANGFVVPDWCFIATWVFTILSAICSIAKSFKDKD